MQIWCQECGQEKTGRGCACSVDGIVQYPTPKTYEDGLAEGRRGAQEVWKLFNKNCDGVVYLSCELSDCSKHYTGCPAVQQALKGDKQ